MLPARKVLKARLGIMPPGRENLDLELFVLKSLIVYARYFDITGQKGINVTREFLQYVELDEKTNASIKIALLWNEKKEPPVCEGPAEQSLNQNPR